MSIDEFEKRFDAQPESARAHHLRVVVFDLSRQAFASSSFAAPANFSDYHPLNENGFPGVTHESRAVNIGHRQQLGLPPMDILGRIPTDAPDFDAYAVNAREPINFRLYKVNRYELEDAFTLAGREIETPGSTNMDLVDAQLITTAFKTFSTIRANAREVISLEK